MSWGNFYEQMKFHMMQHDWFSLQGFCDNFPSDMVFFSCENRMQQNKRGKNKSNK